MFGTCAGLILLAAEVLDGRPDQRSFGALDVTVRRNGYGRQLDSFETELDVDGFDEPFHGVFIRAPASSRSARPSPCSPNTRVTRARAPGPVLAASFHPELAGDGRLHAASSSLVKER